MDQHTIEQLHEAFAALDHQRILQLAETIDLEEPLTDRALICLAFGFLAGGPIDDIQTTEALLDRVRNDGTAPAADIAYVRAFYCQESMDSEGVLEELLPHLDDENSTLGHRMRLCVADALHGLRRFDEIPKVLRPLLEPPGTDGTLEAHFSLLDALLSEGDYRKDRLIEIVSTIDVLMERGFFLQDTGEVIFYLHMLAGHKIEAVIPRLLETHSAQLDRFETPLQESIELLLECGDKLKIPAAVRCAGRSYVQRPFPWKEPSGDRAAYLFASHEEHEAARLAILQSYPKTSIQNDRDLWGPLLLESYHSGHWTDTLELLDQKQSEIAELPIAAHARVMRAFSEYELGRYEDAVRHIEEQGKSFFAEAEAHEAIVYPVSIARLGRVDKLKSVAEEVIAVRGHGPEYKETFFFLTLDEMLVKECNEALQEWSMVFLSAVPEEKRKNTLLRIAFQFLSWGQWDLCLWACDLARDSDPSTTFPLLVRAIAAKGDAAKAEKFFEDAAQSAGHAGLPTYYYHRAEMRRRLGDFARAKEDIEECISLFGEAHIPFMVYVLHAGIVDDLGGTRELVEEIFELAVAQIRSMTRKMEGGHDDVRYMLEDARTMLNGDCPKGIFKNLDRVLKSAPDSADALRLCRLVESAFDATDEQIALARSIRLEWEKRNFATG